MAMNRLPAAAQAVVLRSTGCRATKASPWVTSRRSCPAPGERSRRGSGAFCRNRQVTDTAYDSASAVTARAAPMTATRPLARPRPDTWANEAEAPSLPKPSVRSAGSSSDGR